MRYPRAIFLMDSSMKSIGVFCGAAFGGKAIYQQAAADFGRYLAEQHIELVWGGGCVGLMGVIADAVLDAGGQTYGVIPEFMAERELAHPRSTHLLRVSNMHTRKAAMAERAQAFVALPGGFGTLDELCEIITWAQLHLHQKPIGLLNVNGFFDPFMGMAQHLQAEGFVKPEHINSLCIAANPSELIRHMRQASQLTGDWTDKLGLSA